MTSDSQEMGRFITTYLKAKPALQGRIIGYTEALIDEDEEYSTMQVQ